MFGWFHIQMAALKTLGAWLEGSSWTVSYYRGKHSIIWNSRFFHQGCACFAYVTCSSVHTHDFEKSYSSYTCSLPEGADQLTLDEWKVERSHAISQFYYWSITLDFELDVLASVQSLSEGGRHAPGAPRIYQPETSASREANRKQCRRTVDQD